MVFHICYSLEDHLQKDSIIVYQFTSIFGQDFFYVYLFGFFYGLKLGGFTNINERQPE